MASMQLALAPFTLCSSWITREDGSFTTPSMAQSGSPSAPGAPPPFALCDIWVEVSGYGIRQARDVQIFPGVETVQDFRLPPLEQGEADLTRRDSHTVPPHDL